MKPAELETLLQLCRDNRVASFEQGKAGLKVVFYEGEQDNDDSSLDNADVTGDSPLQRPHVSKPPKPEAPYPSSIFPDGEAPDFG